MSDNSQQHQCHFATAQCKIVGHLVRLWHAVLVLACHVITLSGVRAHVLMQDLTARYGGYLSFSLAVPPKQAEAALQAILGLAPGGHLVHALGGNLRMELPTTEVDVGDLFQYMADLMNSHGLAVLDWGVSHATLEEVFIRIVRDAGVKIAAFD